MKIRQLASALCVAGALAFAVPALASTAEAAKPKNATAKCTDGTYSTAKTKQGACSGHGGVATWYADEKGEKAKDKADKTAAKAEKETKSAAKTAEKETKTAAKATEKETKTAAKATEKEAKTAAKATEKETKTATVARPAAAPADAIAQCNDGTYSQAKQHRGACSNHGGVKAWYK